MYVRSLSLSLVTSTVESDKILNRRNVSDASTTVESSGMLAFSSKKTSSTSSTLIFQSSPFFCFTTMSVASRERHIANKAPKAISFFFISKNILSVYSFNHVTDLQLLKELSHELTLFRELSITISSFLHSANA